MSFIVNDLNDDAQARHEERTAKMDEIMDRIDEKSAKLDIRTLETRFRNCTGSYFGRWLRRVRVLDMSDVADELESHLSAEEIGNVLNLDLVVRGRPKQRPEVDEIWLAIEISVVIDRNDVARAIERANLIRRAGRRVVPVAAGEDATEGAVSQAVQDNVLLWFSRSYSPSGGFVQRLV